MIGPLLRLLSGALPGHVRRRYREEWCADLDGAAELGLSRLGVLLGAAAFVLRLDRDDPAVTGIPGTVLTVRRARWAGAFLLSAGIMALGWLWTGEAVLGMLDSRWSGAVQAGLLMAVGALVIAGSVKALEALRVGVPSFGVKRIAALAAIATAGLLSVLVLALLPFIGLLLSPCAVLLALFLAAGGPRGQRAAEPMSRRARLGLGIGFAVAALAVVALGVAHALVWDPLAKAPGLDLDGIAAALEIAGERGWAVPVMVWAVVFGGAALVFPALCASRRLGGPRARRRILVSGFMLLAAAVLTHWWAAFPAGMAIADTFLVSGADAAPSGPLLRAVGPASVVAALFAGLAPARWRDALAGDGGVAAPAARQ